MSLGFPVLVVRETANYSELKEWGLLKGLLSTSHKFLLLSFVAILSIILASVCLFTNDYLLSTTALFSAFFLSLVTACNLLRSSFLRGLNRVIISDVPDFIVKPLLFMLFLLLGHFSFSYFNAQRALNLQIVASLSAFLIGLYFLYSRLPQQIFHISPIANRKKWFSEALPFLGISIVGMLDNQVSLYQIGYLSGSLQAGLYQAANQFVGLIGLGLLAVNIPLQPEFSRAWALNNHLKAQQLVTNAARISTILAILGALVLFPFAENLLGLLSERYTESAPALRILIVGQMFNAMVGPCGVVLAMSGYQVTVMVTVSTVLILKFLLGLVLIPHLGIFGAAIASAIGIFSWNFILSYLVYCKLNITTHVFHTK